MQKVFIADESFSREYSRNAAHGHKYIRIDDAVNVSDPIKMQTDGDVLQVVKVEDAASTDEVYIFACKEFGLTDYKDTVAKIAVVFCDDGWMFVTLLQGALIIKVNDELLMPTIGDVKVPKVVLDDVLWVNADTLSSYREYLDNYDGRFLYDYEFVIEVTGQLISGMRNFNIKMIRDENIDLSLGYIAQYDEAKKAKENACAASKLMSAYTSSAGTAYEFDDDDTDDTSDYDDEDYSDDYDDY